MIRSLYTFACLALCWLAGMGQLQAQCTTAAGTIAGAPTLTVCSPEGFFVGPPFGGVLDSNDIQLVVAFTGTTPAPGNILATSATGDFPYQASFLSTGTFNLAAVAGTAAGGTIDWNDPCLSVSPAIEVTYSAPPVVTISPNQAVITCNQPAFTLAASANQPNCTFHWSNNVNTDFVIINTPGSYCVTVTNEYGCSSTNCITVQMDANIPVASITPPPVLTCALTTAILDGTASSSGPNYIYQWFTANGNIISAANTLHPVINEPGTYTLMVTDVLNGCTALQTVSVFEDITPPQANAGQDVGLPCGGGSVTLYGNSSSIGGNYAYQWTGAPNLFNAFTLTPITDQAGTYTLVVTNTTNACTATDQVTVYPGPIIENQNISTVPLSCNGGNDGSMTVNMTQGVPPYTYLWNNGMTTQTITGLVSGTYEVAVTDATGCTYYSRPLTLVSPPGMFIDTNINNAFCPGSATGGVSISVTGGVPPYSYAWSNSFFTPALTNLQAGTYTVTVTGANGCTATTSVTVGSLPPIVGTILVSPAPCSETTVLLTATGGTPPFQYLWNNNVSTTFFTTDVAGAYTVTITDAQGCSTILSANVVVQTGSTCSYISGQLIDDEDENCIPDAGEPGLGGWLVLASNAQDTFFAVTQADGRFYIHASLGDYAVSALAPNALWEFCPTNNTASLTVPGDTVDAGNLMAQKIMLCPHLSVDLTATQLRRCFTTGNNYYVNYENDGTGPAIDAYIVINLDPLLSIYSASVPFTNLGNNQIRFNLGDIDVNENGSFFFTVSVSCAAALGQTHCTEAHIYPDMDCAPTNPLWSGALLDVRSVCAGDSLHFIVKNVGTGNMTAAAEYVVVEDHVMLMQDVIAPLIAGDSVIIAVPANGSTWRLEVDPIPYAPVTSIPVLSVEGCTNTSTFTVGIVNEYFNGDNDPWLDVDCTSNIGSYDPNDKQAIPAGYGQHHYIKPETPIEYLIRFQNTGTDTAFTVVVVDTLSAWFDIQTVKSGPSSHPYQFEIDGSRTLKFRFDNILLPDSTTNEPGSHGFVRFSVQPKAETPLETILENRAAIYFDFNDPVITNTVFHTIGDNFLLSGTWHPAEPSVQLDIMPNPMDESALLQLTGLQSTQPVRAQVFNLYGQLVREITFSGSVIRLERTDWPSGMYLLRLEQDGKWLGSGKLMVR